MLKITFICGESDRELQRVFNRLGTHIIELSKHVEVYTKTLLQPQNPTKNFLHRKEMFDDCKLMITSNGLNPDEYTRKNRQENRSAGTYSFI